MSKSSLLAVALVGFALMPAAAYAQRGGGGHAGGGGGHIGGGGVGGGRVGGGAGIPGMRGGYYGGGTAHALPFYGRGGYGYGNNFGGRGWYGYGWGWPYGFGYGLGFGLGYGGFGGYGGYLGYGGYGYDLPLSVPYFPSTYVVPNPLQGYGQIDPYGNGMALPPLQPQEPQQLQQLPAPRVMTASVEIYLPNKDADLWFNGVKTQQTGQKRQFITPELQPGKSYTYEIRAVWMEDGKQYDQTRTLTVQAGRQVVFAFFADKKEQLPPPNEPKN